MRATGVSFPFPTRINEYTPLLGCQTTTVPVVWRCPSSRASYGAAAKVVFCVIFCIYPNHRRQQGVTGVLYSASLPQWWAADLREERRASLLKRQTGLPAPTRFSAQVWGRGKKRAKKEYDSSYPQPFARIGGLTRRQVHASLSLPHSVAVCVIRGRNQ